MNFLPFGYLWLIKKNLEQKKIKTVLDLGCGKGDFGILFNKNRKYEITGVEIYKPYLELCRKSKKYKELIKADLTKKLKFKDKSFDAVVCFQVIEHLKKRQGMRLILEMERIAKRKIIIAAPVGECSQESYDENSYQEHHSVWKVEEFMKKGFKVYGVGLKLIYGEHSHAQEKKIWRLPGYFISYLFNPIANFFPKIGAQMIAVKIRK